MNFEEYKAHWRSAKKNTPNQDIVERWQKRVLANGWQNSEEGAVNYLNLYGKSIGSPKCIMLARYAEVAECDEFANVMWEKAFSIDHPESINELLPKNGETRFIPLLGAEVQHIDFESSQERLGTVLTDNPSFDTPTIESIKSDPVQLPEFGMGMQPGRLVTMQPTDAQHDRDFYIHDDRYWGQPKRDGNKLVVFATPKKVWYQSRQLKVGVAPSPEMDRAFMACAETFGSFIMEGEVFFLDFDGKEHMTGATCQARNVELGHPEWLARPTFSAFGCLWLQVKTNKPKFDQHDQQMKFRQIVDADFLMDWLEAEDVVSFMKIPTAKTTKEKNALCMSQETEGREGEVWFLYDLKTRPGKITSSKDPQFDGYVRTKYRSDPIEVVVTNVLPSRANGHSIGGIQVSLDGKDIGRIGTGYTRQDQAKILALWQEKQHLGREFKIKISTQGWTAYGKVRHGVFVGFVE